MSFNRYRANIENNLSEVEGYVSQPTRRGIDDSRNLLDQIKNNLLESAEKAFYDNFDNIDPEAQGEAQREFLDWKTTTKDKLEDLGRTVEIFQNSQDFPYVLNVTSTGGASQDQPNYLGVFNKTTRTHDGKPVWKHNDRNIFICFWRVSSHGGDKWLITKDVNTDAANIASKEPGPNEIPQTGWKYYHHNSVYSEYCEWKIDGTLEVRGSG